MTADKFQDRFRELAAILRVRGDELARHSVVAGFDGFVDELIEVVDERSALDAYRALPTIGSFGAAISAAAGHSSLREIVLRAQDPGGCAVNLADGLVALGVPVDLFATLGAPEHPAFAPVTARCRHVESWGSDPGRTLAFEFQDGKYMLASKEQLQALDPEHVAERLASGRYAECCRAAAVIALTDWTMFPHMTACWRHLHQAVFAGLGQRPWLVVDLVDPRSRSRADQAAMLDVLQGFEGPVRTCFCGNRNEANALAALLGLAECPADAAGPALLTQAEELRARLAISQVMIHGTGVAATAGSAGHATTPGRLTANPRKSTGAGDRFNAGFVAGLLLDLAPEATLLLAHAHAGHFVRTASCADPTTLADFLDEWAAESG